MGLGATLLFFASVLIHELSHAIVANTLGQAVSGISLFIFGGMAHMGTEPTRARNEFLIAGVGPLTSLVLGALFWAVSPMSPLHSHWPMWASVFKYLRFINLALTIFNLLPGLPLDGGRIFGALLWTRWNDFVRATAAYDGPTGNRNDNRRRGRPGRSGKGSIGRPGDNTPFPFR